MANQVTPLSIRDVLQNTYTRNDTPGVLYDLGSSSASGSLSVSDLKTLVRNPNWRTTVAHHGDASSGYTRIAQSNLQHYCFARSFGYPVIGNKRITAEGRMTHLLWFDPTTYWQNADDSGLADLALARLKNKINGQSQQVNALIPVVELRELRGTISSLANATSTVLQAAILAKRTKGRSAAKAVADLWLTWSFGIKPMLSDIKAISDAINESINGVEKNVVLRAGSRKDWSSSVVVPTQPGPFGTAWKGKAQFYHRLSYLYTAGLDINIASSNNYGVQTQLGLNLKSLPSVLWELTAFSWVVDYFSTVGAYLDDTFSTNANACRYVTLNKRYEIEMHLDGKVEQISSSSWPTDQTNIAGRYKGVHFTRVPFTQIPNRILRFKSVDEVAKNAINKLANLSAVYAGFLSGPSGHRPFK